MGSVDVMAVAVAGHDPIRYALTQNALLVALGPNAEAMIQQALSNPPQTVPDPGPAVVADYLDLPLGAAWQHLLRRWPMLPHLSRLQGNSTVTVEPDGLRYIGHGLPYGPITWGMVATWLMR